MRSFYHHLPPHLVNIMFISFYLLGQIKDSVYISRPPCLEYDISAHAQLKFFFNTYYLYVFCHVISWKLTLLILINRVYRWEHGGGTMKYLLLCNSLFEMLSSTQTMKFKFERNKFCESKMWTFTYKNTVLTKNRFKIVFITPTHPLPLMWRAL